MRGTSPSAPASTPGPASCRASDGAWWRGSGCGSEGRREAGEGRWRPREFASGPKVPRHDSWRKSSRPAALTGVTVGATYVASPHMEPTLLERTWKKGSAELLVLSLLEHEARHGYELGKLIDARSRGVLRFHVASLYPLLYRLEKRGVIAGRWVEKAGQRRRRYYRLTPEGKRVLAAQRRSWTAFAQAIARVAGVQHA